MKLQQQSKAHMLLFSCLTHKPHCCSKEENLLTHWVVHCQIPFQTNRWWDCVFYELWHGLKPNEKNKNKIICITSSIRMDLWSLYRTENYNQQLIQLQAYYTSSTRHAVKQSYHLPKARTNYGKFNVRFQSPIFCNGIDVDRFQVPIIFSV